MTERPSDELVARMVALVRELAGLREPQGYLSGYSSVYTSFAQTEQFRQGLSCALAKTRAIAADLPAPVDPDLLIVREAIDRDIEAGGLTDEMIWYGIIQRVALAAIKRVRAEG